MIIDGRTASPGAVVECDILIIGSGPAGITLATELMQTGARIALLESGGDDFDDRAQELNDGEVTALDRFDMTAGRLRLLGGTSNHWGGHCLPLDEIDFARAPLSGLTGWPFSRAALTDAYERASVYCKLGRFDYSLAAVKGLAPADLLLPDDPEIETTVIRQSTPVNFGTDYGPALAAAENVQIWLWTTALEIDIDADGLATGVGARNIDGEPIRFTARDVVLACGAIENARLLLANNARLGTRFGNAGGFLGGCYMDHVVGGLAFLHLADPVRNRADWTHQTSTDNVPVHLAWRLSDAVLEREKLGNSQIFLIPYSSDIAERREVRRTEKGLGGLKSIAKWALGRDGTPRLSEAYCSFIMNADALAVHGYEQMTGGTRVNRLLLRYEAEQLPERSSYVKLGTETDALGLPKAVLNWSPSLADRDTLINTAMAIGRRAGAIGLGRVEIESHFDKRYWDAETAWHQMGTTRMSVAPSDGVVDPDCRVHGTKNLYAAGGGVFPSGGRANPTMTIVALSVRLADHLRSKRGA